MAVGRSLGDQVGGHHAAGAWHVLDHERLAERVGEFVRQHAAPDVGIAAGTGRRDQADRPVGIRLGLRECEERQRGRQSQAKTIAEVHRM